MAKRTEQPEIRDFVSSYNNGITALYVVNPAILALDDGRQRGKPFLFYHGTRHPGPIRQMTDGGAGSRLTPYVGRSADLEQIMQGRSQEGIVPETVVINGEKIKAEDLCSIYVPFSFGIHHESDVIRSNLHGLTVRVDLDEFKQVLQRYDQIRTAEAARKKTIGYKVRRFFGGA